MSNYSKKLAPMEKSNKKYEVAGFDTEFCAHHVGKDAFVLGTISYPDGTDKAFTNGEDFVNEILRYNNRSIRFYAHNLNVDLANGIEPYIPDNFYANEHEPFNVMKVGSRVIKASITDTNRHQWDFYDSSQISWYAPLAKLGDIIGIEKLDPDVSLKGCNCDLEPTDKLIEYGKRDSRIVTEWMNNYLQDIVINKFNSSLDNTLAGTTMGVWRRNYQDETYYILPDYIREDIRKAYNGGRTEMFYKGYVENVNKYDVNSLYPFIYTAYDFPHPHSFKTLNNPSKADLFRLFNEGVEGFATCTVKCPTGLNIPYLKYFNEDLGQQGKLTFPSGVFTDTWTLLELRKAKDLGYEFLNVDIIHYSEDTHRPWRDFAIDLYGEKERYKSEGAEVEYLITKAFLNSLWGRFGVDPTSDDAGWLKFTTDKDKLIEKYEELGIGFNGRIYEGLQNGDLNFYFEPFDSSIPNYTHPEWASYTTASARHELYKWFELVGLDNVLYCDTDSVLTTKKIPDKYISSDIGMMDLEFTGHLETVREKGYVMYNIDGTIKEVVGSGIDQEDLGKQKARDALVENGKITQQIWGGPSINSHVDWGKIKEIEKEIGRHWVPKRNYYNSGESEPIKI